MIDAVMYPMINKQVPGLKFIPEGDDCLRSKEWVKPLGMGVPKGDPVYLEWLQAVADEMRAQLKSQEVQMVKEAAK
jgi:polar amino acid transport system substrate-binding protein